MFRKNMVHGNPGRNRKRRKLASVSSPLEIAAGLARGADRILTALAALFLILVFLYACFALWDTWRIYNGAGIDESLMKYKPESDKDNGDSFEKLMEINPDVCAWLTIENTHIDYPVLQGEDNVTYVNTNVYGEFSLSGSIFLDYRNAPDFTDFYSLIYGHHMDGDAMFGELSKFLEKDYFYAHRTGTLFLPDSTCDIEFFAVVRTDAYDARLFHPDSSSSGERTALLQYISDCAVLYDDMEVNEEDRLISLSTCSDAATNARTVILGRLQPSEESRKGGEQK